MNNVLSRLPYDRPPRITPKRWGWGLAPIDKVHWDKVVAAARLLSEIVDQDSVPVVDQKLIDAIGEMKGRFAGIYLTSQPDWYSSSRLLGHPSSSLSRAIASSLQDLRQSIRDQDLDLHAQSLEFLRDNYVSDMLDNFLSLAAGEYPEQENGCAYIVWSPLDRNILHIGATEGDIDDVVNLLNAKNRFYRHYGVLAAWLVHDPDEARRDISRALEKFAVGDQAYMTGLGLSRSLITDILERTDNTILSPWHPMDGFRKPIVTVNGSALAA